MTARYATPRASSPRFMAWLLAKYRRDRDTPAPDEPDLPSFAPVTDVTASSTQSSAPFRIQHLVGSAPISVVGGEYNLDGGAFTTAPGTAYPNQIVRLRGVASADPSTETTVTVTIGSLTADFSMTTEA